MGVGILLMHVNREAWNTIGVPTYFVVQFRLPSRKSLASVPADSKLSSQRVCSNTRYGNPATKEADDNHKAYTFYGSVNLEDLPCQHHGSHEEIDSKLLQMRYRKIDTASRGEVHV